VSATNNDEIIAKLRTYDAELANGYINSTVRYDRLPKSIYGRTTVTRYYRSYYAKDGRYHVYEKYAESGEKFERVFDGNDDLYICENRVQFNGATHLAEGKKLFGPNCYLGRGLSALKGISIITDGSTIRLIGVDTDGWVIDAVLDCNNDYIAKTIIRKSKSGEIVGQYSIDMIKRFDKSPSIAVSTTYTGLRGKISQSFSVNDANFSAQKPSELSYDWHKPGLQIIDMRLGEASLYNSNELPPNTTSAKLLEMSRAYIKKAALLTKRVNKATDAFNDSRNSPIINIIRFSLLSLILISFILYVRKQIKRKGNVISDES